MDVSGIINDTNISQIETIILDYNENIRYYNRNFRDLIGLYSDGINEERLRRRQRQNRFYNNYYTNTEATDDRYVYTVNNLRDFQDVIIRPTNEEIELATETVIYDPSYSQVQCPISLEPFQDGDEICRIRHCRHLFRRTSLMNWFERNVRCPVCRYDIRDYNINHSRDNRESITNTTNMIRNLLTNEISRNIPYINNTISDFIFSFNLPLDLDSSYNEY